MKRRALRWWDHLSLYLPVLLMGALALASWWLVRTAPQPVRSAAPSVLSDTPDYRLQGFSVQQFDAQGTLRSQMWGSQARHYPVRDVLEVDVLRTRSLGPTGTTTTAHAQRGISNSDSSEVQLWGNAEVRRSDGAARQPDLVLQGEFFHAWTQEERVRSHLPVVITRGGNRWTGNQLDYHHLEQVLVLQGQVRGVLQPRKR